jgi:hypothetical protein
LVDDRSALLQQISELGDFQSSNGIPRRFRIVTRSNVSAAMRGKINKHVMSSGVGHCDIWSGAEFEEFLRHGAESLLKRFTEGEAFPDAAPDLLAFAHADKPLSDVSFPQGCMKSARHSW